MNNNKIFIILAFKSVFYILESRIQIFDEINKAEKAVKTYLVVQFKKYLNNPHFLDAIPGHLAPYGSVVEERTQRIKKILSSITEH